MAWVVDPVVLTETQPDLADFELHKMVYEVDLDGAAVPGVCAAFYRRADGDRTLSVGIYMMDGVELFRAWGHTDEDHCSFHTVPADGSRVHGPFAGCPEVRVEAEGDRVTGVSVLTRAGEHRTPVTRGEALVVG